MPADESPTTALKPLIKVDDDWRIIAKVFHHEPAALAGSAPEDN